VLVRRTGGVETTRRDVRGRGSARRDHRARRWLEAYFDRLEAHVGGGQLSEVDAHAHIAELHERYAARFCQDPTSGRRIISTMAFRDLALHDDDDGPAVRLERQYLHPVERVWRAIIGPDEPAQWFPPDAPLEVTHSEPPHLFAGPG